MMPHQWGPLVFATAVLLAVIARDRLRRKGQW
jgi:hypothetical protein